LSDETDSGALTCAGDAQTIIIVLAEPPSESLMSIVSGWLRYGTCDAPEGDVSAEMTSPSALRDLLIAVASFSRSPCAPDLSTLSDPAKSTRVSLPTCSEPVRRFVVRITSETTRCDRDDSEFILVA